MDSNMSHETNIDELAQRLTLIHLGNSACPGCGLQVPVRRGFGRTWYECEPCQHKEQEERKKKEKRDHCVSVWHQITPPQYQIKIYRERIHPAIALAMDIDMGTGVGLVGVSGAGKTRVAFWLLRRAAERGLRPARVTAAEFREAVSQRHSDSKETASRAEEIVRTALRAKALVLDDIGKGASTKTGDESLFNLLEHRSAENLLTIWTANGGSKWLKKRLGPDYGPAICRRLVHLTGCNNGSRIFVAGSEP